MRKLLLLLTVVFTTALVPAAWSAGLDNTDPRYPQRSYRRFLLPNRMKVMLISDTSLQRGAASMTVAVGSMSDPPERQGLAHFLEHMLFLGTEKYPEAGTYQKFVSTHDGFSNAFTAEENTNYHFEISPDHLEEGLDRFAEFFISPRFNQELVDREMQAVDSEHSKNIPNDFRRIFQVKRLAYEEDHPARHFATGTSETLASVTRQELLEFYHSQYSSNRMTLAVAGPQSLDTLQDWVAGRFNRVEDRDLGSVSFPEVFLKRDERFRLMRVKTVKDTRSLRLIFPLPKTQQYYRSRPLNMLGFLIGHEGKGSLLSLLKKEGLATGLSAGGGDSNSAYSSFDITIQLTPKGLKRHERIIERVFQFLRMLRQKSLPRGVFDEVRKMAEIDYRFAEKTSGTRLANMFSILMQYYPLRSVETAPFLITEYKPRLFDSMLFRLTPDNMLAVLAARDVATDSTERFYGTEYSYKPKQGKQIGKWKKTRPHPDMTLPETNPFLPESLVVLEFQGTVRLTYQSLVGLRLEGLDPALMQSLEALEGQSFLSWTELLREAGFRGGPKQREALEDLLAKHALGNPRLLRDDERARVWFQQDFRFRNPKARLVFLIHSPLVYDNARHAVLSQLYTDAISEGLNEFAYPVRLAGLEYSIGVGKEGINLGFEGYSDRILELVKTVSTKLKQVSIDAKTFETLREKRLRRYRNFQFQQPYQQAFYYRSLLLEAQKHSIWDYEREIQQITIGDVKAFAKQLYEQNYVEGMVYGNLWMEPAREALDEMLEELGGIPLKKLQRFTERVVQLRRGSRQTLVRPMEVENSATVIEVQAGQREPVLRGALMVIENALQPRFYNDLRTRQQLGYIVNSGMTELEKTLGMIFIVQSGEYDASVLEKQVEAFLQGFYREIADLPDEELETLKRSVINGKLQKTTTLSAEAGRLYSIAFERDADFDYNSAEIGAVQKLTRDDLRRVIRDYLLDEVERLLLLRMEGRNHQSGPVSGDKIEDIRKFKQAHPCPEFCIP